MLKKLLVILFALSPLFTYAVDAPLEEKSEIGRYQMVSSASGALYLLDTTTGHVWRSTSKTNYLQHDTWVLQIASFEN